MTDREAQDLIRMVESNWSFDLEKARALWRTELLPYDAEIVTQAIVRLARTMTARPRLADLLEVVRTMSPTLPPASDSCATCEGNLFVTVYLRKPVTTEWMREHGIQASETEMIEEVAPCPACNADANTSFRRPDGSEAQPLDPAKVRELIASNTLKSV